MDHHSSGHCKQRCCNQGPMPSKKRKLVRAPPNEKRSRLCISPTVACLIIILAIHVGFHSVAVQESSAPVIRVSSKVGLDPTIDSANQCPEQRAELAESKSPKFKSLSEFMEGSIEPSGSEAVCIFKDDKISVHFPHAMQQLYACWSYWQSFPDKKSVLSIVRDSNAGIVQAIQHFIYRRRNKNNPFLQSFWKILQERLSVRIMHNRVDGAHPMVPLRWDGFIPNPHWEDGYALLSDKGHANSLRDELVATTSCPQTARIGILNREGHRSLLNVKELREAIQRKYPGYSVTISYFEGKSFREQIEFFGSVDVLISPHGAQLTGVPFMPSCGQVVEFFPEGYLIPDFFGSLAKAAGIGHFYFYLGNQSETVEQVQEFMMEDRKRRSNMRKVSLCPAVDQVVDAVEVLRKKWESCCVPRTASKNELEEGSS